jgi:ParB family chromosome partitioning protein
VKVEIGKIKVAARIRKQVDKIDELAADIEQNGLLNPITVMGSVGGEFHLLAGLRRLKAAQLLGWTEIDVNEVPPKDAEAALRIEFSENEQREEFTFAEKMDYARLLAEIERAKAKERQREGGATFGRGQAKKVMIPGSQPIPEKRLSREVVGEKIGMSGPTYQRAAYVAEHAAPEVIEQIDSGEKSITGAYWELRAAEKAPAPPPAAEPAVAPSKSVPAPALKSPSANSPVPDTVPEPAPPPETPLERAIRAERELDALRYQQHNAIYHRDSVIENLKRRVAELEEALETAQARIRELEEARNA